MIIFLYGQDTFRLKKKLNELKAKYLKEVDPSGAGIFEANGAKLFLPEIKDIIAPQSLFARKRMAIIENIFQNKNADVLMKLSIFLGAQAESGADNIIIFIEPGDPDKKTKEKKALFGFLSSGKYAQEFKILNPQEIISWITSEAKSRSASISAESAQALAANAGNDLWMINNELDKLIAWKKSGLMGQNNVALIDKNDVAFLSGNSAPSNIFALTDAIGARNKPLAIRLLEEQIEAGANELQILSMIIKHFKTIVQIKSAIDAEYSTRKITSTLKLHPFVAQKGILQARNYSVDSLKKIITRLVDADFQAKKGKQAVLTSLDLFIADL